MSKCESLLKTHHSKLIYRIDTALRADVMSRQQQVVHTKITNWKKSFEGVPMRKSILGVFVLISVVFCLPVNAQISNATVSGTIEDATKAVLPGVTVTATNTATGVVTTAV